MGLLELPEPDLLSLLYSCIAYFLISFDNTHRKGLHLMFLILADAFGSLFCLVIISGGRMGLLPLEPFRMT